MQWFYIYMKIPASLLVILIILPVLMGISSAKAAVVQESSAGTWKDTFGDTTGIAQQTNTQLNPITGHEGLVNVPTRNLLINTSFGVQTTGTHFANDWASADGFGITVTHQEVVSGLDPLLYKDGRAYRLTIDGATAAGGYGYIAQGVPVKPNTTYTMSASGASFVRNAKVTLYAQDISTGHAFVNLDQPISWAQGEEGRKSVSFTTTNITDRVRIVFGINIDTNLDVVGYMQVGSMQLEENSFATAYTDGSLGTGYTYDALESPGAPTVTPSSTGGSLPAGTYCYAGTASNANGETKAGPETCVTTTGTTSSIGVAQYQPIGSTSIQVYGRTTGSGLGLLKTISANQSGYYNVYSYTDTGSDVPGIAPPISSTATAVPDLSSSTRTTAAPFYRTDAVGSLTSSPIKPATLGGWTNASWTAEPNGQSVKIQILDGSGTPVPDTVIPGNGSGFSSSPIDLSGLTPKTYPIISLKAILSTINSSVTPYLDGWSVAWNPTPSPTPLQTAAAVSFTISSIGGKPAAGDPTVPPLPTFIGTAPAGSTVTVTVHSNPLVCTAITSSDGNWTCHLGTSLPSGEHSVLATAVTPTGQMLSLASYPITVGPQLAQTGDPTKSLTIVGIFLILTSLGWALSKMGIRQASHA